jgi:filamentous hemagglutinin family protein
MNNTSMISVKPMAFAILLAFSGTAFGQLAPGTLPSAPAIANGTVGIANPVTNVMQITNTPGAIINWGSFSIGSSARVTFDQTAGPGSAVLNRVTGTDPSQILGRLESNGRVFLVNPNGVLFGAGSVVDAQSLIASTRDISNTNFLAGNYAFQGTSPGQIVVDNGAQITTAARGPNGQVWLFADKIAIQKAADMRAPDGQVMLAAGSQLQVGTSSLGNMLFTVTTTSANTIDTYGSIAAQRGAVAMFADSIVHSGQMSTGGGTGEILLMAARDITVKDGAIINASGENGEQGGRITLNAGNRMTIEALASVAADGSSQAGNGGQIDLVAYDLQVSPVTSGMGNVHASARASGAANGDVRILPRSLPVDVQSSSGPVPATLSSGTDMYPAVTHLADGTSVVTWMSMDLPANVAWDTSYSTIYMQRFAANGQPLGGRVQVGSMMGKQSFPTVTPTQDGGFLIAWSDGRTGRREVWARTFGANGMPLSTDMKLSTDAGDQDNVKVATLADGRMLVTWSSRPSITPLVIDIRGQLMDAKGNPIAAPFTINMTGVADKGSQYRPDIAPLADGGFVVTYHANAPGSFNADAFGRRFDRNGTPIGPEFSIAASLKSDWRIAAKGLLDGGYIVVWDTVDAAGATRLLYRRYDARGVMVTGDTAVGFASGGTGQSFAQLTPMADGGYVIAWMSYQNGTGNSNPDVYAQRFSANGQAVAAPKLIAGGVAAQWEPRIAATADNGYSVTWYTNQNGGNLDIYAQRFASPVQQAAVAGSTGGELRNRGYATAPGMANGQLAAPVLILPNAAPVVAPTSAVPETSVPPTATTPSPVPETVVPPTGTNTTAPTETEPSAEGSKPEGGTPNLHAQPTIGPAQQAIGASNAIGELRSRGYPPALERPNDPTSEPASRSATELTGKTESALNPIRLVTPSSQSDFVLPGSAPVFENKLLVTPIRGAIGTIIGYSVSKEKKPSALSK